MHELTFVQRVGFPQRSAWASRSAVRMVPTSVLQQRLSNLLCAQMWLNIWGTKWSKPAQWALQALTECSDQNQGLAVVTTGAVSEWEDTVQTGLGSGEVACRHFSQLSARTSHQRRQSAQFHVSKKWKPEKLGVPGARSNDHRCVVKWL